MNLKIIRRHLQDLTYSEGTNFNLGKGAKKNLEKSVRVAFTHTYNPVKTNIFPFFSQAYMENFEKCAKTQKLKNNILSHVLTAPCDQDTTPYGSKPLL